MKATATIIAAFLCATGARAADDCGLKQVASLDMTTLPNGNIAVPAKIEGEDNKLIVAIGAAYPEMTGAYATKFANFALPARFSAKSPQGDVAAVVQVHEIRFGDAIVDNPRLLRVNGADFGDRDAVGTVTLSLLRDYDVEIDFQKNKLNIFSQNHCDRPGVYWAKTYASIHFDSDMDGHITFPMTLDGVAIRAGIATDPGHATMTMAAAHRLFGLSPQSDGIEHLAHKSPDGHDLYDYPFTKLSAEGFVFANPYIYIAGSDLYKECRQVPAPHDVSDRFPSFAGTNCYGGDDLNLGLAELRKLHMYFSLRDDMLYFTSSDAHI